MATFNLTKMISTVISESWRNVKYIQQYNELDDIFVFKFTKINECIYCVRGFSYTEKGEIPFNVYFFRDPHGMSFYEINFDCNEDLLFQRKPKNLLLSLVYTFPFVLPLVFLLSIFEYLYATLYSIFCIISILVFRKDRLYVNFSRLLLLIKLYRSLKNWPSLRKELFSQINSKSELYWSRVKS
jgi:hypothetical protein